MRLSNMMHPQKVKNLIFRRKPESRNVEDFWTLETQSRRRPGVRDDGLEDFLQLIKKSTITTVSQLI
jgi:hypothetical protein